jgi:hypothetical protein
MNGLRVLMTLVVVVLPVALIEIALTVPFAYYNRKALDTCHCVNDMTMCMVDNINYIYPKCESTLLFNNVRKNLEYVIIADLKYYLIINFCSILSFLTILSLIPLSKFCMYLIFKQRYVELENELDVLNV